MYCVTYEIFVSKSTIDKHDICQSVSYGDSRILSRTIHTGDTVSPKIRDLERVSMISSKRDMESLQVQSDAVSFEQGTLHTVLNRLLATASDVRVESTLKAESGSSSRQIDGKVSSSESLQSAVPASTQEDASIPKLDGSETLD